MKKTLKKPLGEAKKQKQKIHLYATEPLSGNGNCGVCSCCK